MKGLFNFSKLGKRIRGRTRYLSHIKFREPILVFESDDWGMERKPSANLIQKFGEPGEWAEEQTESVDDLQKLYDTLGRFKDARGRPACFTANFIMANPDFEGIEQEGFAHYRDIPLDVSLSEAMRQQFKAGIHRKSFYPQYHGRKHFCPETWLKDLRENVPGSRELFSERCNGGLSLLKGMGWRYHSEYVNWASGAIEAEETVFHSMKEDLQVFEKLFGYKPLSVIPPHYIFTSSTEKVWNRLGIRYIQGADYRLVRRIDGSTRTKSHYLGELSKESLTYLTRTARFDPRPTRPAHQWEGTFRQIESCFKHGLPAIVDTHRINYTGIYREEGLRQLDKLLEACMAYQPLFLSSVELGEAVSRDGEYTDVFDQKVYSLHPIENILQPITRILNPYVN